jgi:hypothetical protein
MARLEVTKKRKVTKTELLQNQEYLAAIAEQLLQNQFALGKLDIRAAIAASCNAIAA